MSGATIAGAWQALKVIAKSVISTTEYNDNLSAAIVATSGAKMVVVPRLASIAVGTASSDKVITDGVSRLKKVEFGGGGVGPAEGLTSVVRLTSGALVQDQAIAINSDRPVQLKGAGVNGARVTGCDVATTAYAFDLSAAGTSNIDIVGNKVSSGGYGVLVNDGGGGKNMRIVGNTIENSTGDSIELNNPPSVGSGATFKGAIIALNILNNSSIAGAPRSGFGIGIAQTKDWMVLGNIIQDAEKEGLHTEDAQTNGVVIGNIIKSRADGIKKDHTANDTPQVTVGNQIVSNTAGSNYGIRFFDGAGGPTVCETIVGNRISGFAGGVHLGTCDSLVAAAQTIVAGNVFGNTYSIVGRGSNGGGEQRQYGDNLAQGGTALFQSTGGQVAFGFMACSSNSPAIFANAGYLGFMPSSCDGFAYPFASFTTAIGTLMPAASLFPAGASQRFYGRLTVKVRRAGVAEWGYYSANVLWDGATLTVSNVIKRVKADITAAMNDLSVDVFGGNLRLLTSGVATVVYGYNYIEFRGEYWDA